MVTARSGASSDGSSGAKAEGGSGTPPPLPPPLGVDLSCFDGVRALSSIGIVSLHAFFLWQVFPSHEIKHRLVASNLFVKLVSAGMVWVDVLFVLSACLAVYTLLPALENRRGGSSWAAAATYWRRRAARVLPAYTVAAVLSALVSGPSGGPRTAVEVQRWLHFSNCGTWRGLWANLLLLQNTGWGCGTCAIHLWTVALQAHLYLALPILLVALRPRAPAFRTRLAAALAAAIAAGTAWRLHTTSRTSFDLPIADFAVDTAAQHSWAHMLQATYLPTPTRVAELAVGAALGLLLRSPSALRVLQARKGAVGAAALGLQAAYAALLLHRHVLFRRPGAAPWPLRTARLLTALLSFGSPAMSLLVAATLLALALRADPLHAAAARLLSARAWRPLARLSYSLYLAAEHGRLWALLALARVVPAAAVPAAAAAHPLAALVAIVAGSLAAGYACALPLHLLIEAPFA